MTADLIHKQATLTLKGSAEDHSDDLTIAVAIVSTRENYGRTDVLITPMMGEGRRWVRLDSLEIGEGS